MTSHLESRASKAPSTPADRIIRNRVQERHAKQLWFFVASVILFFAAVRLLRFLVARLSPRRVETPSSPKEKEVEKGTPSRTINSLPTRLWLSIATAFRVVFFRWSITIGPGCIASLSELTFIWIYMAAMFVWLFVDTRDLWTVMYQDRAAHLATCQLSLVVALAGKNNVISWLTGVSHEKLNVLHRAAARTCLLFAWIHAATRVVSGLPAQFSLENDWMRAGALGLAAFTMATILSIRPIRNAFFEFFLVAHIVLIFIFLVSVTFHARYTKHETYIWPALIVWAFDRALRLGRLVLNNRMWTSKGSGDALVELVSEDTIRLTLRRKVSWTAGQHAYVILPSVSRMPFEAHPFSIASIPEEGKEEQDVVFLIRGRSGFTERLRKYASTNHATHVPAFLDGPYGCPPDLSQYSTCILVAGGSGISYTLPLLLDLIKRAGNKQSTVRRIVFIWAVRDGVHLTWISKVLTQALDQGSSSLSIEPRVYITGKNYPIPEVPALPASPVTDDSDSEKKDDIIETELPVYSSLKLIHGRPSIKKVIHDEISTAAGPVSVDVAGPSNLTESIRKALSTDLASPGAVLKGAQPVTLHVETFGMAKK